ncbi:MAG TPA: 5-(carboxyamino)imidazole ribonucleotide mutase [Fervidobacterium sp.]|nr:5-(carboxyamino)imidazole ribonucleotide mutase [Fervidobacterium sp.]
MGSFTDSTNSHPVVSVVPVVSIVMGSDSDLKVMKDAAKALEEFGVPYEMTILSAHRTPEKTSVYAQNAEKRGIEVIIAGAGGAAHLPGVIASLCNIPVIGVPIKSTAFDGMDSLLSIVQMPKGIPVATVGINNAYNAGLLAVKMLSLKYAELRERTTEYRQKMAQEVEKKAKLLEEVGYERYEQCKEEGK